MDKPLVSILMPVKNTETYLIDCLDSIIKQQYQHWELIAVNDHSIDNSLAILEQYAQKDKRIFVFNNQEKGIISALRLAYRQSQGHLITRMDSDDLMSSNKIEQLTNNLLHKGKGHLATGLVKYFSNSELGEGYKRYASWLNKLSSTGQNFKELYKECVIPSPCWMVYREDLDAANAFLPNRYPEDYDLCFRFYKQGLICIPSSEILHHWRDSEGRTSRHDPNYANNSFLDIKLHYFLQLDYKKHRSLVLWGAGKKGKAIAKTLIQENIPFTWICNNKKKIGKDIYQQRLYPVEQIQSLIQVQIIVAIAQPEAQINIKQSLRNQGLEEMNDFFFFC